MASTLIVRNLTITPLELKQVERFDGEPVHGSGLANNLTSALTGLFNSNSHGNGASSSGTTTPTGVARRNEEPSSREELRDVLVHPFTSRETPVKFAKPGHEVLRLTFEQPGTGHRYVVEAPGPSPRSLVMTREGEGDPSHAGELTAVYLPHSGFLAIFSSANLSRWMQELSGSYPLSVLSIPGTHNSPTYYVALPSVRCQAVSVREQLDNGVRFLDIRVSVNSGDNDDLALVHSAFPVSLTGTKWFKRDLLSDVYGFLDANPSETVLMSVKREGTGKGNDQQLSTLLAKQFIAGEDAQRWYTAPRIPTLDEARGKVVLVRRFGLDDSLRGENDGAGYGIDGSTWPDNCEDGICGGGQIRVQDFYEVDQSTNIEKKIQFVHSQLERSSQQLFNMTELAASDTPPACPPVFINFLSASNFFNASCWPEKIAAKVNPATIEYLCTRHGDTGKGPNQLSIGDAATGVVVTDWVGHNGNWDLIRCVVGWNSRLQLKQ